MVAGKTGLRTSTSRLDYIYRSWERIEPAGTVVGWEKGETLTELRAPLGSASMRRGSA